MLGLCWPHVGTFFALGRFLRAFLVILSHLAFLGRCFSLIFIDSMYCARTAALQGGYEKQKVNASKVFLQQSLQHVEKCRQERNVCQHMANLGLQNRGWSVPSREKNDQKGRQMQQDAKNAPKKRLRAKNVPT